MKYLSQQKIKKFSKIFSKSAQLLRKIDKTISIEATVLKSMKG
jgi:hypothetical protein